MSNNIVHTLYTRIIGNRWGEAVVGWPLGKLAACRVYYIVFGYFGSRQDSPKARTACLTTHKVLTRWLVHGNMSGYGGLEKKCKMMPQTGLWLDSALRLSLERCTGSRGHLQLQARCTVTHEKVWRSKDRQNTKWAKAIDTRRWMNMYSCNFRSFSYYKVVQERCYLFMDCTIAQISLEPSLLHLKTKILMAKSRRTR